MRACTTEGTAPAGLLSVKLKTSTQFGGAAGHGVRVALQQKKSRSQRGMLFATTVAVTTTEAMRKPKSLTMGSASGGKMTSAGPRIVDPVAASEAPGGNESSGAIFTPSGEGDDVGVDFAVRVGVPEGVSEGVCVGVLVGVTVDVAVPVGVCVGVTVPEREGVGDRVLVAVYAVHCSVTLPGAPREGASVNATL